MDNSEIIRVENLKKVYSYYKNDQGLKGTVKKLFVREKLYNEAVKEVSFSVKKEELIGFIGPNGAGKTTLLKMVSGILYPTSGEIDVMGYVPYKRKNAFLKKISIVMGQKNQLWWDLPARDSFYLHKKIYEIPNEEYNQRVSYLTKELEVEEQLDIQVRKLSLGQRMKLEIVAALLHDPEVLLLDEPTIGLDIKSQKTIRKFIREYNQQMGKTIILTSHYMKDVQELCKRIIIINQGEIKYNGLQDNLMKQYSEDKVIKICFNDIPSMDELARYGEIDISEDIVKIKVPKMESAAIITQILNAYDVLDIGIEEAALEDVIEKIL